MSNNYQSHSVFFIVGLFLIILSTVFTLILDMTATLFFMLSLSLLLLGFSLLFISLTWLQQSLTKNVVLRNFYTFLSALLLIIGFLYLFVWNMSFPPSFMPNAEGIFWFADNGGFIFVIMPSSFILLGIFMFLSLKGEESTSKASLDGIKCTVCSLALLQRDEVAQCYHCKTISHTHHLMEWVKTKGTCPHCRNPLQAENLL